MFFFVILWQINSLSLSLLTITISLK